MEHILELNVVQVKDNMSFEVKPVNIVDYQVKQLHGRNINMLKDFWNLKSSYST